MSFIICHGLKVYFLHGFVFVIVLYPDDFKRFTNQIKDTYQIVCQAEDRANPSSWAKLQARLNWGLNLAHLRDCRVAAVDPLFIDEKKVSGGTAM